MTSAEETPRLSSESLDTYFASGVGTLHRVSDDPLVELFIDPSDASYSLRLPAVGPVPQVTGMQRLTVDTVDEESGPWYILRLEAQGIRHEAYGLLMAVTDALRKGKNLAGAVTEGLLNMRSVLAVRRRLSEEQQVGLIGELLVVRDLLVLFGEQDTLTWWLGPDAAQHDLAFPDHDVEVKTATGPRREHVIHGTDQLQAKPGRPLWLLSILLTRAGGGAGISLDGLVQDIRQRLANGRSSFDTHLTGLGWRDDDAELYQDRYLLREIPRAYLVDEDFPAITPDRLAAAVPHHERVSALSYRVDLSGRDAGDPGGPTSRFLALTEFIDV